LPSAGLLRGVIEVQEPRGVEGRRTQRTRRVAMFTPRGYQPKALMQRRRKGAPNKKRKRAMERRSFQKHRGAKDGNQPQQHHGEALRVDYTKLLEIDNALTKDRSPTNSTLRRKTKREAGMEAINRDLLRGKVSLKGIHR